MIEAREPFAIVKARTPMNIQMEQKTLSMLFVPEISPYPTVVMVEMIQ
jgi:hypothetical protein